jgi:tetratricopeptide (TPR) repeat protein
LFRIGIHYFLRPAEHCRRLLRAPAFRALMLLIFSTGLHAHPDLLLQIEAASSRIGQNPDDVALYLARADLFRRHQDWTSARNDIQTARQLQPGYGPIDWYAAQVEMDAGNAGLTVDLLSRFLTLRPGHAAAHELRGNARMAIADMQGAAEDFTDAIAHSDSPTPGLYRLLVLALAASGESFWPEALTAAEIGFSRFGIEVALMGMAADLALALDEPDRAEQVFQLLKPGIESLPAWRSRRALLVCEKGDVKTARGLFRQLVTEQEARMASAADIPSSLKQMPDVPSKQACRQFAVNRVAAGFRDN